MSLTVLLSCLVLGMDCTIYILCKWAFGEKYRTRSRRIAARNNGRSFKPYHGQATRREVARATVR